MTQCATDIGTVASGIYLIGFLNDKLMQTMKSVKE